jgi:hypothetical protein
MSPTDASILHGKIAPVRAPMPRTEEVKARPLAAAGRPSLVGRLFRRSEPTIFQRCLAVHIHHASESGGMH